MLNAEETGGALLNCRRHLLTLLLLVAVLNFGWAEDDWKVDGVWLGALPAQIQHPLKPHEMFNDLLTWDGERIMAYGRQSVWVYPGEGVVLCEGRELRLGPRLLAKTGENFSGVRRLLGEPYRTSGALGWCMEDPCYWQHYRRAGGELSILVSNDSFIRSRFPKKAWPSYIDKVWSVRLRSAKLNELQEKLRQDFRQRIEGERKRLVPGGYRHLRLKSLCAKSVPGNPNNPHPAPTRATPQSPETP